MELALDSKAILGEGPCWDEDSGTLYWVDIKGHTVHVYDSQEYQDRVIDVGQYVGAVVPRTSGGLIVTLQHGFYHLDLSSQTTSMIWEIDVKDASIRFNDGKCDAAGRLWAGTMDIHESRKVGALYCMDGFLRVRKMLDGLTISNGLGWSPDNKQMYLIDTPTRQVVCFDFDLSTATMSNGRAVIDIQDGYPDGMCVDEEGMLWIAHWAGSKVTRWNPRAGTMIDEVALPVSKVTSCTFGGPERNDLYITTARDGLSDDMLMAQPLAGGLFKNRTSVKGQSSYAFNG